MRKYFKKLAVLGSLLCVLSSFAILMRSLEPPTGHTGAQGVYCNACHLGNPLNNPGGSISETGLPNSTYTAGTAYDFTLTTSHSVANRKRFGFSIAAVNPQGQPVGTFSTTSSHAIVNGTELSHHVAVAFPAATVQSYTYDSLTWTAPLNPTAADDTVTFYYVGNAADGVGTPGDFIYADSVRVVLSSSKTYTFTGNGNWSNPANWSNNTLPPSAITGSNVTIVIDPAVNGECILDIQQTISSSANLIVKDGKRFRVLSNLTIK